MSHFVRFTGMAMLVSLVACVSPERHRQVLSANRALQEERDDMKRFVAQAQQENARLAQELERIRPRIKDAAELERQKKEVEAILTGLKRGGGGSLPPGVKTLSTTEGLMLRVEGRVLFSSGSTKLSQSGQDTLKRLVDTIRDHTGQVRVAGHTDDDPIKHSTWKTNMRLSAERALAVVEFLQHSGVPAAKMSAAGYGEHAPVQTKANKAENRRVEIVLLR